MEFILNLATKEYNFFILSSFMAFNLNLVTKENNFFL